MASSNNKRFQSAPPQSTHPLQGWIIFLCLLLASPSLAIERSVLLKNGNVLRGDLSQYPGRLVLRTPRMQVTLDREDVELVAADLTSIYQQKSASTTSPSRRVDLVRWCLRVGLAEAAREQFSLLKTHSPTHPQLAILHRAIERHQPQSPTVLPNKSPQHADALLAEQEIEHLSRASLSTFSRRIQPLLLNRCGLAGCHGKTSANRFHLLGASRSQMTLALSRRNLGSTLRQIQQGPPEQSLLWMSANSAHGGLQRKAMSAEELASLLPWIAKGCHRNRELRNRKQHDGEPRLN